MNLNRDQNNEDSIDIEKINSVETKSDQKLIESDENYNFGWSSYSEITNGRFAMIGFLAIILIEFFSQKSFLNWTGIF